MNYLAHGYRFLNDPYFVAGTALPDWMNVLDRKNRARRKNAEAVTSHPDPEIASFAKGCVQHHADDQWFHDNPVFLRLSTTFAVELRDKLRGTRGHQAGFVGHISVELLLDAILIERQPPLLDAYYDTLGSLDPDKTQAAANQICPRPVERLPQLIPRFIQERFLADYVEDDKLLRRMNAVMMRVGLPLLPTDIEAWLSQAREQVRAEADQLLPPPTEH